MDGSHNHRDQRSDIGDVVTLKYMSSSYMTCSCDAMSTGKHCKSKHKYYYLGSNGEQKIVCGRLNHRRMVTNALLKSGGTATIFERVSQNEVSDGSVRVVYKAVGTNVTIANDVMCPLVLNNVDPPQMRQCLHKKISDIENDIASINESIKTVHSDIKRARTDLTKFQYVRREIDASLGYMRTNTSFAPKESVKDHNLSDDKCAICLDSMERSDSCRLYECSHSFHKDCIKSWFGNKDTITCPCCRKNCDVDRYFVYNKYRVAVS